MSLDFSTQTVDVNLRCAHLNRRSEKSKEKTDEDTNKKVEEADKKPPVVHPEGGIHPVCSHASAYSRSALHKAVCDMDLANLQTQLSGGGTSVLLVRDDAGYCPLHSACSLRLLGLNRPDVPCEIVRQLLAAGADPSCVDDDGCTPLHWAARAGDKDVAELLLRKNCPKGMWMKLCRSTTLYSPRYITQEHQLAVF